MSLLSKLDDLVTAVDDTKNILDIINNTIVEGYVLPGMADQVLEAALTSTLHIRTGLAAIHFLMNKPHLPAHHCKRSTMQ